jgi:hypothetical protein
MEPPAARHAVTRICDVIETLEDPFWERGSNRRAMAESTVFVISSPVDSAIVVKFWISAMPSRVSDCDAPGHSDNGGRRMMLSTGGPTSEYREAGCEVGKRIGRLSGSGARKATSTASECDKYRNQEKGHGVAIRVHARR